MLLECKLHPVRHTLIIEAQGESIQLVQALFMFNFYGDFQGIYVLSGHLTKYDTNIQHSNLQILPVEVFVPYG